MSPHTGTATPVISSGPSSGLFSARQDAGKLDAFGAACAGVVDLPAGALEDLGRKSPGAEDVVVFQDHRKRDAAGKHRPTLVGRVAGLVDGRIAGSRDRGIATLPDCRIARLPACWTAERPDCRLARMSDCKIAGLPGRRIA